MEIIDSKLTPEEIKARDRMQGLISKAFNYQQKFFKDRAKNHRRYLNDVDVEKADWQAQIAHPLPHLAIERKASFLADATMGAASRPLFKVKPWSGIDGVRKAQAYTIFMQQQQSEMELTELFYTTFKSMFIDGTAYLHTYWDNQIEMHQGEPVPKQVLKKDEFGNIIREPFTGIAEMEVQMVKPEPEAVVRTDRPGIEQVGVNDLWQDPAATSFNDARFVCRRKFMTMSELKRFEKLGRVKNVDLLKNTFIPKRDFGASEGQHRLGRWSHPTGTPDQTVYEYGNADVEDSIIEIIEFYEPGRVSLLGNGTVPLDLDRSVYRARYPFIKFSNLPQHKQFLGLSEYVICERLFSHVDQMQNMIFDNWEKHLKGITLVESGISETSIAQLKKGESGDVIRVTDLNGIRTERPELMDNSVVAGMGMLLQECKDAMSIDGAMTGTSPGSEVRDSQSFEVFTRISQVTLSITVRRIQDSLRELGRQWLKLDKQFMRDPVKIKLAGSLAMDTLNAGNENEVIIRPNDPNDLPSNADVDVELSAIADVRRDRELRQMVEAINLAVQVPSFKGEDAMIDLFSKIDAFDDGLKYFEKDPQKVIQMAQINAYAAGKRSPTLSGMLNSGQPTLTNNKGGNPGNQPQPMGAGT